MEPRAKRPSPTGSAPTRRPVLRSIEIIPIRIPLRRPIVMAGRRFEVADNSLVRCVDADGSVGWGESTSALATTGEDPASIRHTLAEVAAEVPSMGIGLAAFRAAVLDRLADRPAARSALDLALVDLEARGSGLPAWRWLGGPSSAPALFASDLVGEDDPASDVDTAVTRVAAGARWLKFKIGRRAVELEAATAVEIRRRVGDGVSIGADANEGLTVEEAVRFAGLAAPARLAYLEQPLPRHDLDGLADLRRRTGLAVLADEGIGGSADVERHVAAAAIDGVVLKFQKAGGIGPMLDAARRAASFGLLVAFTGKVAETGIASAALVHAARAHGAAPLGISPTSSLLDADLVRRAVAAADGALDPPPGPGWGVEVDEDALDAVRVG